MKDSGKLSNPTVVLLTESSDRTVIACVRSLYEGNYDFIICKQENTSTIPWNLTKYADFVADLTLPRTDSRAEFKRSVLKLKRQYGDLIIYPTSDRVVENLLAIKGFLETNSVEFPVVEERIYDMIADKSTLVDLCDQHGIAVPSTIDHLPDVEGRPFVANPLESFDSSGEKLIPHLIFSESDYRQFVNKHDPSEYFYQEFVDGDNYGIFLLMTDSGLHSQYAHKVIHQEPNGKSVVKACPADIPEDLISTLSNLLATIGFSGVCMFEMIRGQDGKYYMIESNPRFWGPLQLCVDNGVHFPQYLYDLCTNPDRLTSMAPIKGNAEPNNMYVRYDGYINGFWRYVAGEGMFQRNTVPDDMGSLRARDIWLRHDTKLVFPYVITSRLFYPFILLLTEPAEGLRRVRTTAIGRLFGRN